MSDKQPDPRRVMIYCRVSKVEMTHGEFDSLDGQEARCRDLARAHNWRVVDVLRDASTGSNVDRPSLQALLERARAGEFDSVMVYKIDRLSRSVLDFWTLVRGLKANGVDMVSVTESFDSSTAQGRLMMNMLAGFAEFEREQIVARTKQGLSSRAEAGWWPIRHTPFGYDRVSSGEGSPKTLKPNGNGKWVREAFRRYADGDGPTVNG